MLSPFDISSTLKAEHDIFGLAKFEIDNWILVEKKSCVKNLGRA